MLNKTVKIHHITANLHGWHGTYDVIGLAWGDVWEVMIDGTVTDLHRDDLEVVTG